MAGQKAFGNSEGTARKMHQRIPNPRHLIALQLIFNVIPAQISHH
jgi:hypothetical protein